jgi:hypothetical protein
MAAISFGTCDGGDQSLSKRNDGLHQKVDIAILVKGERISLKDFLGDLRHFCRAKDRWK